MKNSKPLKVFLGHILAFCAIALIMFLLDFFLGLPFCPLNAALKINCPFCGMTRAHLAALRLDLAAAFRAHPTFPLGVPYIFLLGHNSFYKKEWMKKARVIAVIAMTAVFIAIYIFRIANYGLHFI